MQETWLASLRATIESALDPLIAPFSECALVDFPAHPNVGDSAIWLGEIDYLQSRGISIKYVCDPLNYSAFELKQTLRRGPILIHGGGNLGDLWEDHQRLRERVVTDFPDRPIIQLPQTIYFESTTALERARSIFNAHPDYILVVRDRSSLAFAEKHFSCRSRLCPDLAFMIRQERFVSTARRPGTIVYLRRTDKETLTNSPRESFVPPGVTVVDWTKAQPSQWRDVYRRTSRTRQQPKVIQLLRRVPPFLSLEQRRRLHAANGMAQERLEYGCRLLGAGQVIVTDRLHGHILATCLGLPNMVLDNSYGKVFAFVREWTQDVAGVCLCGDEKEALANAQAIALSASA